MPSVAHAPSAAGRAAACPPSPTARDSPGQGRRPGTSRARKSPRRASGALLEHRHGRIAAIDRAHLRRRRTARSGGAGSVGGVGDRQGPPQLQAFAGVPPMFDRGAHGEAEAPGPRPPAPPQAEGATQHSSNSRVTSWLGVRCAPVA
eukprot:scaffold23365_cov115-Isochrysis_galbana.AAC.2